MCLGTHFGRPFWPAIPNAAGLGLSEFPETIVTGIIMSHYKAGSVLKSENEGTSTNTFRFPFPGREGMNTDASVYPFVLAPVCLYLSKINSNLEHYAEKSCTKLYN